MIILMAFLVIRFEKLNLFMPFYSILRPFLLSCFFRAFLLKLLMLFKRSFRFFSHAVLQFSFKWFLNWTFVWNLGFLRNLLQQADQRNLIKYHPVGYRNPYIITIWYNINIICYMLHKTGKMRHCHWF